MNRIHLDDTSDDMDLLDAMVQIREVESVLAEASLAREYAGPVHISRGQEAVAVGLGLGLGRGDRVFSNHRGHHHALAVGVDPRRLIAEIIGHPEGFQRGRGGSMHLFSIPDGFYGTNGIVGDGAALAVGTALALERHRLESVVFSVFGDGAMGTGTVYEAFNLAKLWSLPVVFVCENNGYAEMTPTSVHLSTSPVTRARAFGLETLEVDGTDARAVAKALRSAAEWASSGRPAFVEARCYRLVGHYVGDTGHYRSPDESKRWQIDHDPISQLGESLGISDQQLAAIATKKHDEATKILSQLLDSDWGLGRKESDRDE